MHTATPARAGHTPSITGLVTRGAYEHSRAATKATTAAELAAAAVARHEAATAAGAASVVVRAQAALADHNWTLAARLFAAAADAAAPNPHGHPDATISALEHSARLAASMASPGPSRGERHAQMAGLLGASA